MSNTKASSELLSRIHNDLAERMLAKLQETEPVMVMTEAGPVATGVEKYTATNGDWNAIAKFLKDNNCTADLGTNKGIGRLDEELRNRSKRSDNVARLLPPLQAVQNGN